MKLCFSVHLHFNVEKFVTDEEEMQQKYGVVLPPQFREMASSFDPHCPPSRHPCVGCGAPIHCTSPLKPGFIPSAKFKVFTIHPSVHAVGKRF